MAAQEPVAKFKVTAGGQEHDVTLWPSGFFKVETEVGEFSESRLSDLEERLEKAFKQAKIEHHIYVVLGPRSTKSGLYMRAILRGQHGRTKHYLFTIGGDRVTIEYPDIAFLSNELSSAQLAEINELKRVADNASKAHLDKVYGIQKELRDAHRETYGDPNLSAKALLAASERLARGEVGEPLGRSEGEQDCG